MNNNFITNCLVKDVSNLLQDKTCFKKNNFSFEIQDDFKFLLISISIDDLPKNEPISTFKNVANILNGVIPYRKGDYSWMVNFKRKGEIVDSYFGGDLDSPNSGL